MTFEVVYISFAFFFGLAVRQFGLPPLIGFLAAGFAINIGGPQFDLPQDAGKVLDLVGHLGVLLLLFAVGLKLRLGQITQPQVVGGALIHCAMISVLFAVGVGLALGLDWQTAGVLAVALSFSSTVFSAKMLEEKRDIGAFYGRTAIGILVVQDIIALGVLGVSGGEVPSPWALSVLALPILRPVMFRLVDVVGRDELLVLMGLLFAVVVGGAGFDRLGLGAEIGALAMGLMLSTHRRAKELSDALWSMKEVFLVGFFLQIGMSGLPGPQDLIFAGILVLLLPLKGALFFFILLVFRLRARTAFLAAASLTTYSEFGLIVAAAALPDWLMPLALAVSLSFVLSAPLNAGAQAIFDRFEPGLLRFEPSRIHRDELPADLGTAQIMILGMGRTGTAAYDHLAGFNDRIVGIETDLYKVKAHRDAGRNVLFADVEDAAFWRLLELGQLEAAILAMDHVEAKEHAARALRGKGFAGPIVSHALYEDHIPRLRAAGATQTYLTMNQAGVGLADHALREIEGNGKSAAETER
ncbi:MAG: sodium:proton exchanger [Rhodobacter sp.]|nr:sodium:proton exchanger [Rhodobacter sp.]